MSSPEETEGRQERRLLSFWADYDGLAAYSVP